jgi:hypothetical protein
VQAAVEAQRTLPGAQFREVRYEALHSAGPENLRTLVEWLGLAWTDAELRAALERNSPDAARAGQGTPIPLGGEFASTAGPFVREPEGFIRQARAGAWQRDLTFVDKVEVWRIAHATMSQVGYDWASPWSA